MTWQRLGVVELRRNATRMWLACTICDVRTDFPLYGELTNWTGRAFLFVHEHREQGYESPIAEVNEALATGIVSAASVPAQRAASKDGDRLPQSPAPMSPGA